MGKIIPECNAAANGSGSGSGEGKANYETQVIK